MANTLKTTAKVLFGVRITLERQYEINPALGIYASADGTKNYLLWSEQLLPPAGEVWTPNYAALNAFGTSTSWLDGLLLSVEPITQSISCKPLGAQAEWGGTKIKLNSFTKILQQLAEVSSVAIPANGTIPAIPAVTGIYLPGKKCEIVEFYGTVSDDSSIAWTSRVIFTGILGAISWGEKEICIDVKANERGTTVINPIISNGNYNTIQDALAAYNNPATTCYPLADDEMNGKLIPITIGRIDKAKLIRTASAEIPFLIEGTKNYITECSTNINGNLIVPDGTIFSANQNIKYENISLHISSISGRTITLGSPLPSGLSNITVYIEYYETILSGKDDTIQYKVRYPKASLTYGDVDTFPIVGSWSTATNKDSYTVQISNVTGTLWKKAINDQYWTQIAYNSVPGLPCNVLIKKYIKVVNGTGSGGRMISQAQFADKDCKAININMKPLFDTNLSGNANADATNNTWVKLLDIKRDYVADTWPCSSLNPDLFNI